MKSSHIFAPILTAIILLTMASCNTNEPKNPQSSGSSTSSRDYCYVTYANTTSKYCAIIFIDGVSLKSESGGDWTLLSGTSQKTIMRDLEFPKDVKIELHEEAESHKYYTKVYTTFLDEGYSFSPKRDYKITIREDRCTINSISAEE